MRWFHEATFGSLLWLLRCVCSDAGLRHWCRVSAHEGVLLPTALNAEFQQRLDKLSSLSGKAFDNTFIKEMNSIHAADGAAFAAEAKSGQNPALRTFAAETVLIVKRHLGSLHALPLETV